jgi:hypothetical protein
MSVPAIAFTPLRSIPCPITALAPELREMNFQYYFEGMKPPQRSAGEIHIGDFRTFKPYFSMLHFSSLVRSEIAYETYKAAFSEAWFRFEVDGEVNDVQRMRDTFACIRTANRDIKLGIRFIVSDHSLNELQRFINSFFNTSMTEGKMEPVYIHCDDCVESSTLEMSYSELKNMDSKIVYTHKSRTGVYRELTRSGAYHELFMFGKLARLDWSRFDFKFKALRRKKSHPQKKLHSKKKLEPKNKTRDEKNKWHSAEDGIDVDFDSDNESVALDSDDDKIEGIFEYSDVEVGLLDTEDEESPLGSECDDDGTRFDSEEEAGLFSDGQEDWF